MTLKDRLKLELLRAAPYLNMHALYISRLAAACARGAVGSTTRSVDPTKPWTWEYSAFSQNGEDGIIDHLLSAIRTPNRYFVEIGAGDGLENNTAFLAYVKKYSGLMIEGDPFRSRSARRALAPVNWSVRYLELFVTPNAVATLQRACMHSDPDFFSLDIDGNDFYIAQAWLELGFRPKVVCVEYNSTLGPHRAITIPYSVDFNYLTAHPSGVYYGVSVQGWRRLFARYGYRFVTVDSRGVNAFFVDPGAVEAESFHGLEGLDFAENVVQRMRLGPEWAEQFQRIADMPFVEIA